MKHLDTFIRLGICALALYGVMFVLALFGAPFTLRDAVVATVACLAGAAAVRRAK